MANYYTKWSVEVTLPSAEAQKYALELSNKISHADQSPEDITEEIPESLRQHLDNWCFGCERSGETNLWVHDDDGNGNLEACQDFIGHLLEKFNGQPVEFEWSNDCDKHRTDGFGGGAAFITANGQTWMSTSTWLAMERKKWEEANKPK